MRDFQGTKTGRAAVEFEVKIKLTISSRAMVRTSIHECLSLGSSSIMPRTVALRMPLSFSRALSAICCSLNSVQIYETPSITTASSIPKLGPSCRGVSYSEPRWSCVVRRYINISSVGEAEALVSSRRPECWGLFFPALFRF